MRPKSEGWIRVTRQEPCPICGRPDWCGRTTDGSVVRCMRMESDRPQAAGGWIHRLTGDEVLPERQAKEKKPKMGEREILELIMRFYETPKAKDIREQVAEQLVVSVESLEKLGVGYGVDQRGKEFSSWPSRNGEGKWVGIVRRFLDGSGKKTYPRTSNSGLFYSRDWYKQPGPVLILEGGSDVAAAVTEGVACIGRPSNYGSINQIRRLLMKHNATRRVVVIGERDEKPEKRELEPPNGCAGTGCDGICATCWPGGYGARRTAEELGRPWILPPGAYKDFREYAESGSLWGEFIRAMTFDYTMKGVG